MPLDLDEKVNSFTRSGGTEIAELSSTPTQVRSEGPTAATFESSSIALSLKRRLRAGATM